MLRRVPSRTTASISDMELGVAAVLLLVTVILTAIVVPALG
jgi:hypothetical protein